MNLSLNWWTDLERKPEVKICRKKTLPTPFLLLYEAAAISTRLLLLVFVSMRPWGLEFESSNDSEGKPWILAQWLVEKRRNGPWPPIEERRRLLLYIFRTLIFVEAAVVPYSSFSHFFTFLAPHCSQSVVCIKPCYEAVPFCRNISTFL